MRVVVTGAAGFLGKYIIENLHARYPGAQVFGIGRHAAPGIEAMVLPSETFCHLVRDISPDVLIHAASPASVPFSVQHPFADFTGSVGVFAHVLDCVRLYAPACKVVLLSSAAVYGDPIILPVHEQSTLAPVSPYGFHKQMCELLAQEYVRVYGLKVAGVRIFSAYGNGLRRQLLWDICQQVLQTGAIYLSGTGQEPAILCMYWTWHRRSVVW
jgi:UDP-glucose 4-epimerase